MSGGIVDDVDLFYVLSMLCWAVEFEQDVFAALVAAAIARGSMVVPLSEEGCRFEPAHGERVLSVMAEDFC